ncbi:MAG: hypothetical protein LBV71_12880 [Prevotella sp.]|jgi:tetratricopeptide (TPR) repeat protein|nr:hypothetical protein [Prevotella sp.]
MHTSIKKDLEKAAVFFKRKKYDVVISYCDNILRLDKDNEEATKLKLDSLVGIVRYYLKKKDYATAMHFSYVGLEIDKLYPPLVHAFLDCCFRGGFAIGSDYKKEILDTEFNYIPLIEYKAALLDISEGTVEALKYLENETAKNPDISNLYFVKGFSLFKQNKFEEAMIEFDKSIELADEEIFRLHLYKALSLANIGKHEEAAEIMRNIKTNITDIIDQTFFIEHYKQRLPVIYELIYGDEQSEFNRIVTQHGIKRDLNNPEYKYYAKYFVKKHIYSTNKKHLKDKLIFLLLKFKLFRNSIHNFFLKKEKQNKFTIKAFCPNIKKHQRKIFKVAMAFIFSLLLYCFLVLYLIITFFVLQEVLSRFLPSYTRGGNIDLLVLYLSVTVFTIIISSRSILPAIKDGFNEGYIKKYLKKSKTNKIQQKSIRYYMNLLPSNILRFYTNHYKVAHFYNKIPKNPVIAGKIEKYRISRIRRNTNFFRYLKYLFYKLSLKLTIIKQKDFSFEKAQKFTVYFIYFTYFSLILITYIFKYGQFEFIHRYFETKGIDIAFVDDAINTIIFSLITFMAFENIRSTRNDLDTSRKPAAVYPDGTDAITKK